MADLLNRVHAVELRHCFEQWDIRMRRCIDRKRETLKGVEINSRNIFKMTPIFHIRSFIKYPELVKYCPLQRWYDCKPFYKYEMMRLALK
jgi:hypothetical protein